MSASPLSPKDLFQELTDLSPPWRGHHERHHRCIHDLPLVPAHIPELLRIALLWGTQDNEALGEVDSDDSAYWAPIHAMRALGSLGAQAFQDEIDVVEPFLGTLRFVGDSPGDWYDFFAEEFAAMCEEIGASALPTLERFFDEPGVSVTAQLLPPEAMTRVALVAPDTWDQVVAFLAARLERHREQHRDFNSELVGCLADLQAEEHETLIKEAFDAGTVDTDFTGSWEEVSSALLGLEDPPLALSRPLPTAELEVARARQKAKEKARSKRKSEKAAKRKVRGRK